MGDMETFFKSIPKLGHLVDIFKEQEIDYEDLEDLTDADLEKIGIDKLGNRRKILKAIASTFKKSTVPATETTIAQPDSNASDTTGRNSTDIESSDNSYETGSDFEEVPKQVFDILETISERKKLIQHELQEVNSKVVKLIGSKEFFGDLRDEMTIKFGELNNYLSNCMKEIEDNSYPIVVTGETSSGKSSFINLLLGVDILPTSPLSCTAAICRIHNCKKKELFITYKNGDVNDVKVEQNISTEEMRNHMKKHVMIQHNEKIVFDSSIQFVDIWWPIDKFPEGMMIVDTPGYGPDDPELTNMLFEYLPHALAFIYIINSANNGGVQKDRLLKILEEMNRKIQENVEKFYFDTSKALFICNKWDQVHVHDDDSPKEVYRFILKELQSNWGELDPNNVFTISVHREMERRKKNLPSSSSLVEFLEAIKRTVPSIVVEKERRSLWKHQNFLNNIQDKITARICQTTATKQANEKRVEMMNKKLKSIEQSIPVRKNETKKAAKELCNQAAISLHTQLHAPDKKFKWCPQQMPDRGDRKSIKRQVDEIVKDVIIEEIQELLATEKRKLNKRLTSLIQEECRKMENDMYQMEAIFSVNDVEDVILERKYALHESTAEESLGITKIALLSVFLPVVAPVGVALFIVGGILSLPYFIGSKIKEKYDENNWLKNYRENKIEFVMERAKMFLDRFTESLLVDIIEEHYLLNINQNLEKYFNQTVPTRLATTKKILENIQQDNRKPVTIWKDCCYLQQLVTPIFGRIKFAFMYLFEDDIIKQNELSVKKDRDENGNATITRNGLFLNCNAKVLSVEDSNDETWSFLADMITLKRIDHRNLLKVYGICFKREPNVSKEFYLLVENYDRNLENVVMKSMATWSELLNHLTGALEGLVYLHRINLIHKHIQLETIVIKGGDAKLAKIEDERRVTRNVLKAPEVTKSNYFVYESDIFQFGVVLWECWYRRRAFDHIKSKDNQFVLPFPEPYVIYEVKDVIMQCLDTEPGARPSPRRIQDAIVTSGFNTRV